MGRGLERGKGMREELLRRSCCWRDPFEALGSMELFAAISPGVLISDLFTKECSPPSSCGVGDSVLLCFRSFRFGISSSRSTGGV